mmetsp:Transcript_7495/g.26751  ORF Transcript_7495/g.26751 Transcript_7495/m.26751 type:complete len:478 (+) Transcript_7495:189-1622(+)
MAATRAEAKGVDDVAVADDEAQVVHGASIAALLATHRAAVDALAALVADALPPSGGDGVWMQYDEIFFLRYILSYGSAAGAEEAVRATLAFRAEPRNLARIREAARGLDAFRRSHLGKLFEAYYCAGLLPGGIRGGGFLMMVRGGPSNMPGLQANVTQEEQFDIQISHREIAYAQADRVARSEGRLVKQVIIFDMADVALSTMLDRRTSAVHARVSKLSAVLYPQMQDKLCILNAPTWMEMVINMFKTILPARVFSRTELYSDPASFWATEWAQRTLVRSRFPKSLGGTLDDSEMPGYLTGACLRPFDADTTVTVMARQALAIDVPVAVAGTRVKFSIVVESHGIAIGAVLIHGGAGVEACAVPVGGETVLLAMADEDMLERGEETLRAADGPLRGEWLCAVPGVVRVTFNNTYSIFRSKAVRYCFDLVMPTASVAASGAKAGGAGGGSGGSGRSGGGHSRAAATTGGAGGAAKGAT